jgi:hypothetical protein
MMTTEWEGHTEGGGYWCDVGFTALTVVNIYAVIQWDNSGRNIVKIFTI